MSHEQNPQVNPQSLPTDDKKGRDANGRFAQGNTGGPGNPYARQTAKLRQAMLDNVSADDIGKIIQAMVVLAIAGNVQAAKLVLNYALGKPTETPNPDRLDQEEFNGFKEANGMYAESTKMVLEPHSQLPVTLLRGTREGMHIEIKNQLMKGFKKLAEADEAKKQQTPIGNGGNGGQSPIPNGGNGGVNRVNRHGEARLPNGGDGGNRMHEPSGNGKLHPVQ